MKKIWMFTIVVTDANFAFSMNERKKAKAVTQVWCGYMKARAVRIALIETAASKVKSQKRNGASISIARPMHCGRKPEPI